VYGVAYDLSQPQPQPRILLFFIADEAQWLRTDDQLTAMRTVVIGAIDLMFQRVRRPGFGCVLIAIACSVNPAGYKLRHIKQAA
jgi:hypothetical protein